MTDLLTRFIHRHIHVDIVNWDLFRVVGDFTNRQFRHFNRENSTCQWHIFVIGMWIFILLSGHTKYCLKKDMLVISFLIGCDLKAVTLNISEHPLAVCESICNSDDRRILYFVFSFIQKDD